MPNSEWEQSVDMLGLTNPQQHHRRWLHPISCCASLVTALLLLASARLLHYDAVST